MKKTLILASASPRRAELLTQLHVEFKVRPVDIDESARHGETPDAQVVRLATEKAREAMALLDKDDLPASVVLASDTLIALDGKSLGKPRNKQHSREILQQLSGREHEVLTAVCICSSLRETTELITTQITFAQLTDDEIDTYWNSGEPADKAGSYAIQGLGGKFVKAITGSYSAVVGLPLYETHRLLKEYGVL